MSGWQMNSLPVDYIYITLLEFKVQVKKKFFFESNF